MKTLSVTASSVEVNANSGSYVDVDIMMADADYYETLRNYLAEDIVSTIGSQELLDAMDIDDIIHYVNDCGVMTKWEDQQ